MNEHSLVLILEKGPASVRGATGKKPNLTESPNYIELKYLGPIEKK